MIKATNDDEKCSRITQISFVGTKELFEPPIRHLFKSNLPIDCVYAYDHRVYGDSSLLNIHYHDAWGDGVESAVDFSTTVGQDGHAVAKWIRSQWPRDGKNRKLICVGVSCHIRLP